MKPMQEKGKCRDFCKPAPRQAAGGFTLIELLVVIAVIAILASLLLPALAGVKEAGEQTRCKTRLKNWAVAMITYADDRNGLTAHETAGSGGASLNTWDQVADANSGEVWYNALALELQTQTASNYFSKREEFYDNAKVFHCPKARFPANAATDVNVLFSIAMNSQLIKGSNVVAVSLFTVTRPSQTLLFTEGRLDGEQKFVPGMADTDLGQPSLHASRVAVRHRGAANVSMVDGSAHSISAGKLISPLGKIIPNGDPQWDH
jgi:prepilin-type N-terminal cleavage/methylation domain-containing protein/prepilin-type processing-associated H-X9-DG protein